MLKGLLAGVVFCATLLSAADCGAQKQGAQKTPTQTPGAARPQPAKAVGDQKVVEIDENALKSLLKAGEGRERLLLVNFWATWCVPCREEFPDLVKIRERYTAEQLDFVLVSLDDPAEIDKAVPEFLKEVRATHLPSYLLRATDDSVAINLVDPTWGGELPATFLYDRSGGVVFKHKGRVKPAELTAALDAALAGRPAAPPAP